MAVALALATWLVGGAATATETDPVGAANRLGVTAQLLVERAAAAPTRADARALLIEARAALTRIMTDHPTTAAAVAIAAGTPFAGLTRAGLSARIAALAPAGAGGARALVEPLRAAAAAAGAGIAGVAGALAGVPASVAAGLAGLATPDGRAVWLWPLCWLIATGLVVAGAWLGLRPVTRRLATRLAARAEASPMPARWHGPAWLTARHGPAALAVLGAAAAGAAAVVAAAAAGAGGAVAAAQLWLVTAVLVGELGVVATRAALSRERPDLRPLPIADAVADAAAPKAIRLIRSAAWGLLFALPALTALAAPSVAMLARAAIGAAIAWLAVRLVLAVARTAATGDPAEVATAPPGADDVGGRLAAALRRRAAELWPGIAVAYIALVLAAWVVAPADGVPVILIGSVVTVAAAAAAVWLWRRWPGALDRLARGEADRRHWSPPLDAEVARFLPIVSWLGRALVVAAALAVGLAAWRLLDLATWLGSEPGLAAVQRAGAIALIVSGAILAWVAFAAWVHHCLSDLPGDGRGPELSERARTLVTISRNAVSVLLSVVTTMLVLSELGLDIGPLIAGAGVVGLAVGFGAQTLVKDVITGLFMLADNAIHTGDYIEVNGLAGTVETLSIRSVGLRDWRGPFHLVPFSTVGSVTNYSRGHGYALIEVPVPLDAAPTAVVAAMEEAGRRIAADPAWADRLAGRFDVLGVSSFGDTAMTLLAYAKTQAGAQWGVERHYRAVLVGVLAEQGLALAVPRRVVELPRHLVPAVVGAAAGAEAPPPPAPRSRANKAGRAPAKGRAAGQAPDSSATARQHDTDGDPS